MSIQDHQKNARLHETIAKLSAEVPVSPATELDELVKRWRESDDIHGGICTNPDLCCHGVCADELECVTASFTARVRLKEARFWHPQKVGVGHICSGCNRILELERAAQDTEHKC
jgi:hypothetical protein